MDCGRFFPFGAATEVVGKESGKVYFAEKGLEHSPTATAILRRGVR